jgi:co-chaperonin GroES (HSP10)
MSLIDSYIPTGTKVIVEVEKLSEKTLGGIVLPREAIQKEQDRITEGTFRKMGPVAFADIIDQNQPLISQIPMSGDTVYFVKYAGKALSIEDKEYRIIHDEDIYAFESAKLEK